MSTTELGRSTVSRIRSTSVVPPAMYRPPSAPAARASASVATLVKEKGYIADHRPAAVFSIAETMFGYAPQRQMLPLIHSLIVAEDPVWPSAMHPTPDMICPDVQ